MPESSPDLEKQSRGGSDASPQSKALQRTATHARQHAETVGARKPRKIDESQWSIGGGKPFPEQPPAPEGYVVDFEDEHDPLHPQNWSLKRK